MFRDCVDKLLSVECSTDEELRVRFCYDSCPVDGCNNRPISVSVSGSVSSSRPWSKRSAVVVAKAMALAVVVSMSTLAQLTRITS